jgi:hypothetical protein
MPTPRSQIPHDLRAGPPPEVFDEIAAAWERARAPLSDALELCFASASDIGRAWGEVRLTGGEVVTRIPASEAIAIACGDAALDLAA